MSARDCIASLARAAGRALTDDEIRRVFERMHKAARDIRAGRLEGGEAVGGRIGRQLGAEAEDIIARAAREAAAQLEREAALRERQAYLQVVRLAARQADAERIEAAGLKPLAAVKNTMARDFSGRGNVESLEQRVTGYSDYFRAKLLVTWDALGSDYLGFFQDRAKVVNLVRELRGEDTANPLARRGAQAFREAAEEARRTFNAHGGDVGYLEDWGFPQHHSQERVAVAGREAWIDFVVPLLDRSRYVDDVGQPWSDLKMREFLGKAWDTIATDGHANRDPGQFVGAGKRANRHAESRQIHFRGAEATIAYWEAFGERTVVEILLGHIDTMARDIAFIEHFGPNPNVTYQTLRDLALQKAIDADKPRTKQLEAEAKRLDAFYDYVAGRSTTTHNLTVRKVADGIAHLNVAGKLGGASLASLFGDKPMYEAVSHLNNIPALQRWRTELSIFNPANAGDRRILQRQGLMLESVRSGLQRFYEGLGQSSLSGRFANAVMRITGMQAVNDLRKGTFGAGLFSAIGHELAEGRSFAQLADSDVRVLRHMGVAEADWRTWQLAELEEIRVGSTRVPNALTPEAISRIPEARLREASVIGAADGPDAAAAARRNAIVKLLGAVNTESEFAVVTPGWRERATFYSGVASQRGTVFGEVARSVLQFKAFPWAMFQRGMDAIANSDGPASKAVMTAYLISTTTLAGAMLMQVREMLAGKDPRAMDDRNWMKFWGQAFLYGGALGIYGDFLYGINETRYGSGPVEALAGPTLGPLLELGVVQPLDAAKKAIEGKETHLGARTLQDLKGFVPGGNIWYAKAALDHLVWQQVFEMLSPGYLASIRSRTLKEYGQSWWWEPGELSPSRAPDVRRATGG